MNKNKKNRKGFTIVELVIVIAVIGILATVLVPTFGDIIQKAKDSSSLQKARNIYTDYVAKHVDEDGMDVENVTIQVGSDYYVVTNGSMSKTPADSAEQGATVISDASGKCSDSCAH